MGIARGDEFEGARVLRGNLQIDQVGTEIPGPASIISDEHIDIVRYHGEMAMRGLESETAQLGGNDSVGGVIVVDPCLYVEPLELVQISRGVAANIRRGTGCEKGERNNQKEQAHGIYLEDVRRSGMDTKKAARSSGLEGEGLR